MPVAKHVHEFQYHTVELMVLQGFWPDVACSIVMQLRYSKCDEALVFKEFVAAPSP